MNGFQQSQVDKALNPEVIPTYALTPWEKEFIQGIQKYCKKKDLTEPQSKTLNKIMSKFT